MISDEDLILYHYDDGLDAAQRRRIAKALVNDPALAARLSGLQTDLAARLSGLQTDLAALDDQAAPVALDPAVARRWRLALQREARLERPASPARWQWLRAPGLSAVAAAGVLVSFGIGLGQWLDGRPDPQPPPAPGAIGQPAGPDGRSPLLRGVQLHLHDTEALLGQLSAQDPAQRRSLLAETRAQNRLYAIAAEAQDDPQLARVLRAFDRALADLARERDDPQALAADQAQLAFEMAVMQTKLARATSKQGQSL